MYNKLVNFTAEESEKYQILIVFLKTSHKERSDTVGSGLII